jgi:hypothetical protein
MPVQETRIEAIGPVARLASVTLASAMMASRHDVDASMTVRALMRQPTGWRQAGAGQVVWPYQSQ